MERLTKRNESGRGIIGEGVYVSQVVSRLTEYEDTGLEPEEIEDLASTRELSPEAEYAIDKHADSLIERLDALLHRDDGELEEYHALGSIDHLRELVEAERAGRLVVLPCKRGAVLWTFCAWPKRAVYSFTVTAVSTLDGSTVLNTDKLGVIPASVVGKTAFPTREEAEAALREIK